MIRCNSREYLWKMQKAAEEFRKLLRIQNNLRTGNRFDNSIGVATTPASTDVSDIENILKRADNAL